MSSGIDEGINNNRSRKGAGSFAGMEVAEQRELVLVMQEVVERATAVAQKEEGEDSSEGRGGGESYFWPARPPARVCSSVRSFVFYLQRDNKREKLVW